MFHNYFLQLKRWNFDMSNTKNSPTGLIFFGKWPNMVDFLTKTGLLNSSLYRVLTVINSIWELRLKILFSTIICDDCITLLKVLRYQKSWYLHESRIIKTVKLIKCHLWGILSVLYNSRVFQYFWQDALRLGATSICSRAPNSSFPLRL